ncbi:MAG: hypothetical protein ACI4MH_07355 [Candidatus Coproplasma sp.]
MGTLKNIGGAIGKTVLKRRGLSFVFTISAAVFIIATLITYSATGITSFTPVLSSKVITIFSVALALIVLFALFEIKVGKYAAYLVCFWAWLEYVISEMPYISNVLVAIDGNSFSASFIVTVILGMLSWICILVAAIVQRGEIGSASQPENATGVEVR